MYARRVSMQLRPNSRAELVRKFETGILPLLREQEGFRDAFMFVNPADVDAFSISFWDSKDCADAYSRRVYPDVYGILADLIRGTPRVKYFEVVNSSCHKIAANLHAA